MATAINCAAAWISVHAGMIVRADTLTALPQKTLAGNKPCPRIYENTPK